VTLSGESTWEAPAQAELRPTCAGAFRVAVALEHLPPQSVIRVDHDVRGQILQNKLALVLRKKLLGQIFSVSSVSSVR
jgi:hypothetical protein